MPAVGHAFDSYAIWSRRLLGASDENGFARKRRLAVAAPSRFLRASFFLWLWRWRDKETALDAAVRRAPPVLGVGDVHLDNFGSFRAADGGIHWGVVDFDEAARLPFTLDLVRLAASAILARREEAIPDALDRVEICDAILDGYQRALIDKGVSLAASDPENDWLAELLHVARAENHAFWEGECAQRIDGVLPTEARRLLVGFLGHPEGQLDFSPTRKGVGSLGRPRAHAIGEVGRVCFGAEAKAALPSAKFLVRNREAGEDYTAAYRIILQRARRPSPIGLTLTSQWIVRRLSPEELRLPLDPQEAPKKLRRLLTRKNMLRLFAAMGAEIGNIHLGNAASSLDLSAALVALPRRWLYRSATEMARITRRDRKALRSELA